MATDKKYQRKIIQAGVRPFVPSGYRAAAQAAGQSFGMLGRGLGVAAEASADADEKAHKEYIAGRKTELGGVFKRLRTQYYHDPKGYKFYGNEVLAEIANDTPSVVRYATELFDTGDMSISIRKMKKEDQNYVNQYQNNITKEFLKHFAEKPNNIDGLIKIKNNFKNSLDRGLGRKDHLSDQMRNILNNTSSNFEARALSNREESARANQHIVIAMPFALEIQKKSFQLINDGSKNPVEKMNVWGREFIEQAIEKNYDSPNSKGAVELKRTLTSYFVSGLKTLAQQTDRRNDNSFEEASNVALVNLENEYYTNPTNTVLDNYIKLKVDKHNRNGTKVNWEDVRFDLLKGRAIDHVKGLINQGKIDSKESKEAFFASIGDATIPLPFKLQIQEEMEGYSSLEEHLKKIQSPLSYDYRKKLRTFLKERFDTVLITGTTKENNSEFTKIKGFFDPSNPFRITGSLKNHLATGRGGILRPGDFTFILGELDTLKEKVKKESPNSPLIGKIANWEAKIKNSFLEVGQLLKRIEDPHSIGTGGQSDAAQKAMDYVTSHMYEKWYLSLLPKEYAQEISDVTNQIVDSTGIKKAQALYNLKTGESGSGHDLYQQIIEIMKKDKNIGKSLTTYFNGVIGRIDQTKENPYEELKVAWVLWRDLGFNGGEIPITADGNRMNSISRVFGSLNDWYGLNDGRIPFVDALNDTKTLNQNIARFLDNELVNSKKTDNEVTLEREKKFKSEMSFPTGKGEVNNVDFFTKVSGMVEEEGGPFDYIWRNIFSDYDAGKALMKIYGKSGWDHIFSFGLVSVKSVQDFFQSSKTLERFKIKTLEVAKRNLSMSNKDVVGMAFKEMLIEGYSPSLRTSFNMIPGYQDKPIFTRYGFESVASAFMGAHGKENISSATAWLGIGHKRHLMHDLFHFVTKREIAVSGDSKEALISKEGLLADWEAGRLYFNPVLTKDNRIGFQVHRTYKSQGSDVSLNLTDTGNPWIPDYTTTPAYKQYKKALLDKTPHFISEAYKRDETDSEAERHLKSVIRRLLIKTKITGTMIKENVLSQPLTRSLTKFIELFE